MQAEAPWIPTWDLNFAAAEGWRWKAGKLTAESDFSADSGQFLRSQQYKQCIGMADKYAKKSLATVRMKGATARSPLSLDLDANALPLELYEDLYP